MTRAVSSVALLVSLTLGLTTSSSGSSRQGAEPIPPVEELIALLDAPETQWVATAWLQASPHAALPLLLQPGRVESGPHGRWTAAMLALAKLGESAVPAICDRVMAIVRSGDGQLRGAAHPLINILGSIGPAAVPALVQIAEASTMPGPTSEALDEIVRLEPRSEWFGGTREPCDFWRPADDRVTELRRQLGPLLPRIRQVVERSVREWKPHGAAPQQPGGYLLARWGTGETRTRGLQLLDELARAHKPFYARSSRFGCCTG